MPNWRCWKRAQLLRQKQVDQGNRDNDDNLSYLTYSQEGSHEEVNMIGHVKVKKVTVDQYSHEELVEIKHVVFDMLKFLVVLYFFSQIVYFRRPSDSAFFLTDGLRNIWVNQEISNTALNPPDLVLNCTTPNCTGTIPGWSDYSVQRNYDNIRTVGDWWLWIENVFVPNAFPTQYYNGQDIPPERLRFCNTYNDILGIVRLRQHRVKPKACDDPMLFLRGNNTLCYPSFGTTTIDKTPFGPNDTYTYSAGGSSYLYVGQIGYYPSGGYIFNLGSNATTVVAALEQLKRDDWIDKQTRIVILELSLYNPNLDLFTLVKLAVEFSSGAGVITNKSFNTIRLVLYRTSSDYVLLGLEITFLIIVVLLWVDLIFFKIRSHLKHTTFFKGMFTYFFYDRWNLLILLNYILWVVVIVLRFSALKIVYDVINSDEVKNDTDYVELAPAGDLLKNDLYVNSVNILVCWLRLFQFFSRLPHIGDLFKTMQHAALDIVLFLAMFFVCYSGFLQMGMLLFSTDIESYRSFIVTGFQLWITLLGKFDYPAMLQGNRLLGPLFFFLYIFVVFVFLLNMFVAILMNAFDYIREQNQVRIKMNRRRRRMRQLLYNEKVKKRTAKKRVQQFLETIWAALWTKEQASLIELLESGRIDKNKDGNITKDELAVYLSPVNLKNVMATFDVTGDGILQRAEVESWLSNLRREKKELEQRVSALILKEEELASRNIDFKHLADHKLLRDVYTYLNKVRISGSSNSTLMYLQFVETVPRHFYAGPGALETIRQSLIETITFLKETCSDDDGEPNTDGMARKDKLRYLKQRKDVMAKLKTIKAVLKDTRAVAGSSNGGARSDEPEEAALESAGSAGDEFEAVDELSDGVLETEEEMEELSGSGAASFVLPSSGAGSDNGAGVGVTRRRGG